MKRGLKDNTFQNYKYMYDMYAAPDLGQMKIQTLKKSDVKSFYNRLVDERGLKINTVDNIHIGGTHKKALTVPEEDLFREFLKRRDSQYYHWYPIFTVLLGTGMRVGKATGLRWCDIDFDEGIIDVNQTLVYFSHETNGCYFNVHTPKTKAGERKIPMLASVREAFLEEKRYQEQNNIRCTSNIDGYTDFIFVNRFGGVQHQGTLNKALRRMIRDCNDEILNKNPSAEILLPRFSCHSLRHTFTTRLVEAGVNIKVVQEVLGHKDVSTTLDIYTDVTKELAKREFDNMEEKLKADHKITEV